LERHKILDSVDTKKLFGRDESAIIEWNIDNIVKEAKDGKFKRYTVDKAPLRTKYFFGEGYTYGGQLQERGAGNEKLYPKGEVDPIPDWIKELVIKPVEESGIVRSGWINSAVINDYLPGGCIVSHIDPPQLFSRPIITVSFFSDSFLSFGCKFSFKPIRVSKPVAQVPVRRGGVLSMYGYSANHVTHCIRPEDIESRRAVIILRHVPHTAPRMTDDDMEHFRKQEEAKKRDRERSSSPSRSNVYIVDTRRRAWPEYQPRRRKNFARYRSRSRERYGNASYQDYRRRRDNSRDRVRSRSRSRRRSKDRSEDRRERKSRSVSRHRRSRSRSESISQSESDENCRSPSLDKYGRNKVMQNVYHGLKHRGITSMSSRTVDKFLQSQNVHKHRRIASRSRSKSRSRRRSRSRSISKTRSGVRDRVKEEINKQVPVSKNVQSAILKNIIGSFKDNDDSSDSDGTVSSAVNKITTNNKLDKEEEDFKDRLQKLKMKITDEVKAGKHGNVKIDETKDDKQKGLEKEVEDLKKELKELKEHLNEKNETSSSSSESESEDEPVSVLDIFKTTILQKSKKSTIYIDKKNKKSKLVETKTQKILKERIKMLKNK